MSEQDNSPKKHLVSKSGLQSLGERDYEAETVRESPERDLVKKAKIYVLELTESVGKLT